MEIHPSKLVSLSHEHRQVHLLMKWQVISYLYYILISDTMLNRYSTQSSLHLLSTMPSRVLSVILAYQLRISLRPEILFGKQTHKQLNLLVCYKSILEIGDTGDK